MSPEKHIVELFQQRVRLVEEVGAIKRAAHLPVTVPSREEQVMFGIVIPDRSDRGGFNHDVAIVERGSFDPAKSNHLKQDAVLGDAALLSVHCEHQVQIKERT
jgi:hypothetical protein